MPRTTVTGVYDGGTYGALERVGEHLPQPGRPAGAVLLADRGAAGGARLPAALERPVAFADNDRPGVMLAGAVRAYLHRWSVAPERAAVFTNNDDGWRTAADLAAAGVEVAALVDARPGVTLPAGPWRSFAGAEVVAAPRRAPAARASACGRRGGWSGWRSTAWRWRAAGTRRCT